MIRPLVIATLIAAPLVVTAQDEAKDHLRFTNGDQLEGRFGGFNASGKITWEREDFAAPIELQREKVRQIVLRNARPAIAVSDPSHVTLVNGDRIPGKIVAADETEMTLESRSAGVITLPRDVVASLAPNPFGGRLVYAGPFDDVGWKIIPAEKLPDGGAGLNPAFDRADLGGIPKKKDKDEEGKPGWSHAGAAWYSRGAGDALIDQVGMPDRAVLRFKLGWRTRATISVAFHADLAQPAPKEEKKAEDGGPAERPLGMGGAPNLARLFGSAYILNFNGGYFNLQRSGFDADGNPEVERIRVTGNPARLPESGEAIFEIRCDRKEGTIAVYVNGEYSQQWHTGEDGDDAGPVAAAYQAPGGGIGFMVPSSSGAGQVRISDIVVAEWNGLTDSARSMESDQQDIVLLTNGTDRFSGHIHAIHEDHVEIEAKYATLKIPMQDVAEIHYARSTRRKLDTDAGSEVVVHMKPVGRISGVPLSSENGHLQLDSKIAGKIEVDLAPAVVLELQSAGGFLDEWEEDL